ncbi:MULTISPECIES: YbhB/YbcL family Raf kinase inhibitor-like protein [unclassified Beijerinckia]|uniref:YbhB/YbcL family Raf kinase inhibitor-like protein n=1 Tax=unclassified Beijerinckia TaxID=2638183 RepID=UPI000894ABE8|nr:MULTISPECIES: YbhB/YbcL family Raf kinase inhibitor-like protein [unclassified Beijerinckia]MDH7794221.1 Raf kinase inhibitor-like YbhB/YbcL family protein [Beijerinckia sp. GAS462]SEB56140.1 hypothetical protein SAMN05443249_0488 [Beijerinckia sp. 28-YEA-48]
MTMLRKAIAVAGLWFVFCAQQAPAQTVNEVKPFSLSSPSFEDGGYLALKYGGNNPRSPNCLGANVSPPLHWSNAPAGTKSFALIMVDLQGRAGQGLTHWTIYGIPASVSAFQEGELGKASGKFVGGKGLTTDGTYMGPCAPPNSVRHYSFTLIATDLEPSALAPGLTREELLAKLEGHGKEATVLISVAKHPGS